jgi:hypothetical protein
MTRDATTALTIQYSKQILDSGVAQPYISRDALQTLINEIDRLESLLPNRQAQSGNILTASSERHGA